MNTNTAEIKPESIKQMPIGLDGNRLTNHALPASFGRGGSHGGLSAVKNVHPYTDDSESNQRISIYSGKLSAKTKQFIDRRLRIGNTIYQTLVGGVTEITQQIDFKGLMKVPYTHQDETYTVIFTLFFCPDSATYFLTSLGQYSMRNYQRQLANHRAGARQNERFSIQLSPINRTHLPELKKSLLHTNLSRASVCLLKETLA